MIGRVLTLDNEKIFDKKNVIKFDREQRMNLFRLTIIIQSLLKLKKRKVGDSKHITMIKHPAKTVFCALCWNDKEISERRLEMRKEFMLNKINEGLLKAVNNNLQHAQCDWHAHEN